MKISQKETNARTARSELNTMNIVVDFGYLIGTFVTEIPQTNKPIWRVTYVTRMHETKKSLNLVRYIPSHLVLKYVCMHKHLMDRTG